MRSLFLSRHMSPKQPSHMPMRSQGRAPQMKSRSTSTAPRTMSCTISSGNLCSSMPRNTLFYLIKSTTCSRELLKSPKRKATRRSAHRAAVQQAGEVRVQPLVPGDQLVGEGEPRHEPPFLQPGNKIKHVVHDNDYSRHSFNGNRMTSTILYYTFFLKHQKVGPRSRHASCIYIAL